MADGNFNGEPIIWKPGEKIQSVQDRMVEKMFAELELFMTNQAAFYEFIRTSGRDDDAPVFQDYADRVEHET